MSGDQFNVNDVLRLTRSLGDDPSLGEAEEMLATAQRRADKSRGEAEMLVAGLRALGIPDTAITAVFSAIAVVLVPKLEGTMRAVAAAAVAEDEEAVFDALGEGFADVSALVGGIARMVSDGSLGGADG